MAKYQDVSGKYEADIVKEKARRKASREKTGRPEPKSRSYKPISYYEFYTFDQTPAGKKTLSDAKKYIAMSKKPRSSKQIAASNENLKKAQSAACRKCIPRVRRTTPRKKAPPLPPRNPEIDPAIM